MKKHSILTAIIILLTAACANQNEQKNPYAEDFALEVASTESRFLKDVYADANVTDAELSESRDLFQKCISDEGFELTYIEESYKVDFKVNIPEDPIAAKELDDGHQAKVDKCDREYYGMIDYLYKAPRENPQKEDESQWLVDCLIRNGLEEKDFTVEEFFEKYSSSNPPEWHDTPKGNACENDPKNS